MKILVYYFISSSKGRIRTLDKPRGKCYDADSKANFLRFLMTNVTSLALTGLFLWSGGAGVGTTTWATETAPVAPVPVPVTETVLSVRLTGYNAVPEQTDSNPGVTASGASSNAEVIAARSIDLASTLPYGTVIALETPQKSTSCGFKVVDHLIGYRVIADSMHERKRNQIDIMFNTGDTVQIGVDGKPRKATNPAVALGVCEVSIRVVGKLALKEMPKTQSELALLVNSKFAGR